MSKLLFSSKFLLLLIILGAFLVRLYKIDNPIADWHSWRQADTAAVSRNFFKNGYNPLIPRYDDMSAVSEPRNINPRVLPNPQRYRFVEFPIYNSLVYFAYLINGSVDERLARLVSIVFSLGSIIFLFLITKKYFGQTTALVTSFIYAFLPYNIYFSRVILPEPSLVFFCLGMFYFVDKWIREKSGKLLPFSIFFTACAFLTKPVAIFYLLPLLYSYYQTEKQWFSLKLRYLLFLIFSLTPFILWRIWMSQFPEGIPASNWLFNGTHIRFRPAYWRWILVDRFGREILSVVGTFFFFLGLLIKPALKEGLLLHLLALSSLLYLIVMATGNVQHDYYQYLIVPALAIFTARGFLLLLTGIPNFVPRFWTIPLSLLFFVLMFYFSWNEVKGFYQINNPVIVEAGKKADKILPKDALVVAPYSGDTAFLYQTNRAGLPVVPIPVDQLVEKYGIQYYISVNYDDQTNEVIKKYTVLEKNPKFVIVDLTKKR